MLCESCHQVSHMKCWLLGCHGVEHTGKALVTLLDPNSMGTTIVIGWMNVANGVLAQGTSHGKSVLQIFVVRLSVVLDKDVALMLPNIMDNPLQDILGHPKGCTILWHATFVVVGPLGELRCGSFSAFDCPKNSCITN